MNNRTNKVSKYLSFILRYNPGDIGLTLTKDGWANVDELIEKMNLKGKVIDFQLLQEVVNTNDKKRFTLSECGTKIRANQGHSINVDLGLEARLPPEFLYHGTAEKNLGQIAAQGLQKMSRHQVHLTENKTTAIAVGARYGKPKLLKIRAKVMHEHGHMFFLSENSVWLVDNVPAEYIEFK